MRSHRAASVVIGLGNVALSDDGIGVHAVDRLCTRYELPADVEAVKGGTSGLLLLPLIADANRAIMIDAIDTGAPPGTLLRLEGEAVGSAFAGALTPHDVGLTDLLAAARLTGNWPGRLVVIGVQPACVDVGTDLSPPVGAVLDALVAAIAAELEGWGVSVQRSRRTQRAEARAPCAWPSGGA
jgi:hydrogenase maturation protease